MRTVRSVALLLGGSMLLAACGQGVYVPPAKYAPDPACAEVLQQLPDTLDGANRQVTSSQATAAWGGEQAITLRCGIEPPGPTTDRCLSVENEAGDVDWISVESAAHPLPEPGDKQGEWLFRTYGRNPALEVVVPVSETGEQPTVVLGELAAAAQIAPAERFCLGADEAG